MKKLVVFLTVVGIGSAAFSGPRLHGIHSRPQPPMYGPRIHHAFPPPPPPRHHHHHHSRPFWTGVGVGLVGSLLPTMIAAPQRVWVPPVYGERPIYRAGIYVGVERYIITPGYWTTSY